jgi:hypothetical protein
LVLEHQKGNTSATKERNPAADPLQIQQCALSEHFLVAMHPTDEAIHGSSALLGGSTTAWAVEGCRDTLDNDGQRQRRERSCPNRFHRSVLPSWSSAPG